MFPQGGVRVQLTAGVFMSRKGQEKSQDTKEQVHMCHTNYNHNHNNYNNDDDEGTRKGLTTMMIMRRGRGDG